MCSTNRVLVTSWCFYCRVHRTRCLGSPKFMWAIADPNLRFAIEVFKLSIIYSAINFMDGRGTPGNCIQMQSTSRLNVYARSVVYRNERRTRPSDPGRKMSKRESASRDSGARNAIPQVAVGPELYGVGGA